MDIGNKKYDAFISYRHAELDKFVAETLHKQLEKFKIPKQIRKEKGIEKKSLHIFRDQDELPLSSNLAEPITEALKNSEFLIVICSPRLLESQWCMREIETFISLHGREHIFTVLAEGEPSDSFPKQLLYQEVEEFDEAGNKVIKSKEIEPLAADIRGKNFKQVKKKIKREKLRVLAPMFSLGYDDLRRRHKDRVMKQAMAIGAGVAAALLGFSTVSMIMALEIKEQSNRISEQNGMILEQNQELALKASEIVHQSEQIKKQYEEAQMNYSKSLADASTRILNQGDRMSAIYAARSGMPSNLEYPEKPYTTECEYALNNAMYLYTDGEAFLPYYGYRTTGDVRSMKISKDGAYLVISDSTYHVYVWEIKTQKLLLQEKGDSRMDFEAICFLGEDSIVYDSPDGMCIQNFMTQKKTCFNQDIDTVIPYPDGKHYLTVGLETVRCYNSEDSSLCFEKKDNLYFMLTSGNVSISKDNSKIILLSIVGQEQAVIVLDAKTGDSLYQQSLFCDFASSCYGNGKLLVAAFKENKINDYDANLTCVDLKEGRVLWEESIDDDYLREIHYTKIGKKEYFYVFNTSKMKTYDATTGSLISSNEYPQSITNSYLFNQGKSEVVLCNDGTMLIYDIVTGEITDFTSMLEYVDYRINDFIWAPGAIYIKPKDSKQVLQYQMYHCDKTNIANLSEEDSYCPINETMTYLLNTYYDGEDSYIGLKEVKTGEIKAKVNVKDKDSYVQYFFIGDGLEKFAVIDDGCTIYSVKDGTILNTIDMEDSLYRFDAWSSDGKLLYAEKYGDATVNLAISTETGEIVMEMPENEQGFDITTVYSNDQSVYACYNDKKDELRLYHKGEQKPYVTKQVSLVDIRGILFTDDGKYLCIIASNGNPQFYDTRTMELVKILFDLNISFPNDIKYIDAIQRYVMRVVGGAYLMDENFNLVSMIPKLEDLDAQNLRIYIKNKREIYTIPYYTYEDMIKEADQLLEGYTISEELKRKYNVE